MARLILFNKPFNVLSQFTDDQGRATLADYLSVPGCRVAGRLDFDSEGLLLLTDDGHLQQLIANPDHKQWKTYLVTPSRSWPTASASRMGRHCPPGFARYPRLDYGSVRLRYG